MKEENKIKLTVIATILAQIRNNGRSINGNEDLVLCSVKNLNDLGKSINDIVLDELNSPTPQKEEEK